MTNRDAFFYRTLGTQALKDLVERLNDHIDNNPELNPSQVAVADDNRSLRMLVLNILANRGVEWVSDGVGCCGSWK